MTSFLPHVYTSTRGMRSSSSPHSTNPTPTTHPHHMKTTTHKPTSTMNMHLSTPSTPTPHSPAPRYASVAFSATRKLPSFLSSWSAGQSLVRSSALANPNINSDNIKCGFALMTATRRSNLRKARTTVSMANVSAFRVEVSAPSVTAAADSLSSVTTPPSTTTANDTVPATTFTPPVDPAQTLQAQGKHSASSESAQVLSAEDGMRPIEVRVETHTTIEVEPEVDAQDAGVDGQAYDQSEVKEGEGKEREVAPSTTMKKSHKSLSTLNLVPAQPQPQHPKQEINIIPFPTSSPVSPISPNPPASPVSLILAAYCGSPSPEPASHRTSEEEEDDSEDGSSEGENSIYVTPASEYAPSLKAPSTPTSTTSSRNSSFSMTSVDSSSSYTSVSDSFPALDAFPLPPSGTSAKEEARGAIAHHLLRTSSNTPPTTIPRIASTQAGSGKRTPRARERRDSTTRRPSPSPVAVSARVPVQRTTSAASMHNPSRSSTMTMVVHAPRMTASKSIPPAAKRGSAVHTVQMSARARASVIDDRDQHPARPRSPVPVRLADANVASECSPLRSASPPAQTQQHDQARPPSPTPKSKSALANENDYLPAPVPMSTPEPPPYSAAPPPYTISPALLEKADVVIAPGIDGARVLPLPPSAPVQDESTAAPAIVAPRPVSPPSQVSFIPVPVARPVPSPQPTYQTQQAQYQLPQLTPPPRRPRIPSSDLKVIVSLYRTVVAGVERRHRREQALERAKAAAAAAEIAKRRRRSGRRSSSSSASSRASSTSRGGSRPTSPGSRPRSAASSRAESRAGSPSYEAARFPLVEEDVEERKVVNEDEDDVPRRRVTTEDDARPNSNDDDDVILVCPTPSSSPVGGPILGGWHVHSPSRTPSPTESTNSMRSISPATSMRSTSPPNSSASESAISWRRQRDARLAALGGRQQSLERQKYEEAQRQRDLEHRQQAQRRAEEERKRAAEAQRLRAEEERKAKLRAELEVQDALFAIRLKRQLKDQGVAEGELRVVVEEDDDDDLNGYGGGDLELAEGVELEDVDGDVDDIFVNEDKLEIVDEKMKMKARAVLDEDEDAEAMALCEAEMERERKRMRRGSVIREEDDEVLVNFSLNAPVDFSMASSSSSSSPLSFSPSAPKDIQLLFPVEQQMPTQQQISTPSTVVPNTPALPSRPRIASGLSRPASRLRASPPPPTSPVSPEGAAPILSTSYMIALLYMRHRYAVTPPRRRSSPVAEFGVVGDGSYTYKGPKLSRLGFCAWMGVDGVVVEDSAYEAVVEREEGGVWDCESVVDWYAGC
ncbi:hypothetical protein BDN70DRAFT_398126 [Pholiota conissans]|uniref:Uncharacterized protein n=1 Tax=Pholiota conissans TaxID=109636 RepID=A0A9P5YNZ7_9AGAR|nr:hypothetical protein BDN70DRAFT_398126 [Pholiota conissans]